MRAFLRLLTLALLAAATLGGVHQAQAPKKFEWFEDSVDMGFKIYRPEGWDLIPPQPHEKQMLAEFAPPFTWYINVGPDDILPLYGWLVAFDRRPDEEGKPNKPRIETVEEWIKTKSAGATGWTKIEEKRFKGVKVPATKYLFEGPNSNGPNRPLVRLYAVVFSISEDLDVAMVFNGPPKKKWSKWGKAFDKMAKSFKLVEVERLDAGDALGSASPRAAKRLKLQDHVAKLPGWELYETENYFIVTNNDDKPFVKEAMERMEAIRKVYEKHYPPSKARRVKNKPKTPGGQPGDGADPGDGDGEGDEDGEDGDETPPEDDNRSVSVQADPLEASRSSVVRITATRNQYVDYGGPGNSAGYWSWVTEELVFYDDKANRGRDFTWLVLNHEAFHQYIFYFYGNISPHSWYNEGTGDYYSGFDYRGKKFVEAKAQGRQRDVQQLIREDRYAPLKDFVRWDQQEYYGTNDLGLSGMECYAQGWSLIWFLRTGRKKGAPNWDKSWDKILDTYLATLAESGDLDEAVDKAFEGVDWERFEASWKAYTQ